MAIKKYRMAVKNYRDAEKKFELAVQNITLNVEEDQAESAVACIKKYWTNLPKTDLYDDGNELYPETIKCNRFHENPCTVTNCPFYADNVQYREAQLALEHAYDAKKAKLKTMFQRKK
ncbi:MAG: hypothetical protein J6Y49_00950 [Alphaproteobacteria bacterium]|nr:hypothetical protein [Alphaproteobacteria bacterium]